MKQPPSRKRTFLAFLPAMIVTGLVAGAAAGISLIPSATAADVFVSGTVDATINTPATPPGGQTGGAGLGCNSATPSQGAAEFIIAAGWENAATRTGVCRFTFGASNGAIQMTFKSANPEVQFYCHRAASVRDCTGANGVGTNIINGAAIGANTFGIALESTPVNAVGGASGLTEDGDGNATTGEAVWYSIPASGDTARKLCETVAAGDGECQFRLGLRGQGAAPAQATGQYDGTMVLTAAQL